MGSICAGCSEGCNRRRTFSVACQFVAKGEVIPRLLVFIHLLNCRWSTKLGMTLPEMVFGDTKLEIKNEAQGIEFAYTAYAALDGCPRQVDVQVHTQSHTITHNHTHTHTHLRI
jgi:hypothetical protein